MPFWDWSFSGQNSTQVVPCFSCQSLVSVSDEGFCWFCFSQFLSKGACWAVERLLVEYVLLDVSEPWG